MRAGEGERSVGRRHCVRAAKEMDSKSIGLCPQGFESPRCRLQGWREATENSWRLVGGCDLWAWAKLLAEADD